MTRGRFITFEGGEGSGKSTQARRLGDWLQGQGVRVLVTREVGGCPTAEDIRVLWLSKDKGAWDFLTELLLVTAARREHLVKTVWPALESGTWVVSDRFYDSTRAYQGVGLGLGLDTVDALYRAIAGDFAPDMTLLFDLPVEEGLRRMAARRGPDDRYQAMEQSFHQTLREAYLSIAHKDAPRVTVMDALPDEDAVYRAVIAAVAARFGLAAA